MTDISALSAAEQAARNEGYEAAFNGAEELMDNPYDPGSDDFMAFNDGFSQFHEEQHERRRQEQRRNAEPCVDPTLAKLRGMSADQVAALIGLPVSSWPGRCHEVASLLVRALAWADAEAVYGLYLGPVSPKCKLFASRQGLSAATLNLNKSVYT